MTNQLYVSFLLFILSITPGSLSFASSRTSPYPNLTIHGELYENSCSIKEMQKLMVNIQTNVVCDSRALQNAIEFILCGMDEGKNSKKMASLVDEVVITSYEGTAEEKLVKESRKKMDILKNMMAKGRAWNATLNFDEDEVKLQYYSSEACIESVKLRYSKNSWVVQEIGGACD